jgi:hypothetical protein
MNEKHPITLAMKSDCRRLYFKPDGRSNRFSLETIEGVSRRRIDGKMAGRFRFA